MALEALAVHGHLAEASRAVNFLLAQQHPNGSWADHDNHLSVALTALALRALWRYRHQFAVNHALDAARDFLLAQRANQVWANPFETALALIAILPRLPDQAIVAQSLTALQAAQLPNGSWNQDVYTTALALRALAMSQPPVPNPDLSTLQGRVLDGDTGLPLSGVSVALRGHVQADVNTTQDGRFHVRGLTPGSYHLTLNFADYGALTTTTTRPIAGQLDIGNISLLQSHLSPTTATIRGTVTDAITHSPLTGVQVVTNSQSAMTDAQGRCQLSALAPGEISLTASLDAYLSASSRLSVIAGGTGVFSPRLTPGTIPIPRRSISPVPLR